MEHATGSWLDKEDWPATLEEIRRFLNTWWFSLSDDGFVHVQPQSRRLSPVEVRAFLRRLDLVCDDAYPRIIVFDFSKPSIEQSHWRECESLISEFAHRINAVPMFERLGESVGVAVLVRRSWLRQVSAKLASMSPRDSEMLAS